MRYDDFAVKIIPNTLMIGLSYLVAWVLWFLQVLGSTYEAVQLTELSKQSEDHIIKINGDLSAFTGVRDYYTLVVITSSLEDHKCGQCTTLSSVIARVSKAWFHDYTFSNMLFFVEIDIAAQSNIALVSEIGLNTIPHIWLIPPNYEEQYDPISLLKESHFIFKLPKGKAPGQSLELAQFISKIVQRSIYLRDENPIQNFVVYFVATFLAIKLVKTRGPRILTGLGKKFVYSCVSIVAILSSITGFQFTRIQKIPFLIKGDKGVTYMTPGTGYQLGAETLIISTIYALLTICFVGLIHLGASSNGKLSSNTKNILIVADTICIYLLYSLLTSIALRKDPSYPYVFSQLI